MTQAFATDDKRARSPANPFAHVIRDFIRTVAVYLTVAGISGVSYAVCAVALNGGLFARLWLASVAPIALLLIARSLVRIYRRGLAGGSQLEPK